jgi:hypothetical protein
MKIKMDIEIKLNKMMRDEVKINQEKDKKNRNQKNKVQIGYKN